jgi:hypothetical protein
MSNATAPSERPETPNVNEDQVIREQVRELTSRFFREGQIDSEGVKEVIRRVTGGAASETTWTGEKPSMDFADAVRRLDAALVTSSEAAHRALELIANRGKDVTENDVKTGLASLTKLQEDSLAAMNRLGEVASGNLRRELTELAIRTQNVGAETGARVAAMMNEFASRIGNAYRESAFPSLETARDVSVRVALLTSGVIAGIADALGQQSEKSKVK